jgi:RNA polymerase sigma factor (sigma-70 family)
MAERTLEVPLMLDHRENFVCRAQGGDADAFAYLARDCERTLYRVSRTVLHSDADCADAVQEALTKAWLRLHTLREHKYFRTWLIRILLNECYSILRRGKRAGLEAANAESLFAAAPSDDAIDLREALAALPENQRTAIVLFHVEGLSVEEVAHTMKIPTGTVKSRLARARTKLAAAMRPKEVSYE